MNMTNSAERRKSVRFQGHKKTILIQPNGIHHIRDISLGGLSFHCPSDVMFSSQWPMEIVIAGSLLCVIGVSVRLVREQIQQVNSVLSPSSKEVGVEYLVLDDNNRPLLARLLTYLQQTALS